MRDTSTPGTEKNPRRSVIVMVSDERRRGSMYLDDAKYSRFRSSQKDRRRL
jgi:hypothetical protein